MSILLKGFSLLLKTLTVLSSGSEKSPGFAGGGSVFLQLSASKQEGRGKTSEVVSIWRSQM